ncbi:unnamed protein product, partial [Urochloa humidicola]
PSQQAKPVPHPQGRTHGHPGLRPSSVAIRRPRLPAPSNPRHCLPNRLIPRGLACRWGRKASRSRRLTSPPLPLRSRNLGNYVSLRGIGGPCLYLGSMSKWEPVTFEESLSFVKKVKARDYMLYLSLHDVLNRNDQIPLEAYSELSFLFRHHEDLLAELSKFRPLPCPNNLYTHGSIWMIIFLMPFLILSLVLAFEKPLKCFLLQ